jgi:nucleoside-diphosphate-sugar epimerase
MGQTVLVTGGAGYVGSVLCEHLLQAGHDVICLDTLALGQAGPLHLCAHPGFEFVRADARDEGAIKQALARCDAIMPLAAVVGAPACDRDPTLATALNLDAIRLLERLRSPRQLVIYPTTNSGYGTRSGAVECTEETPLEPVSLYGRTKVAAEALLLAAPNTITLRFATVFGSSPRMRTDLLVNHFVHAAVTDGYLVVFEKDFRRNFIHVRDAADAFVHCLANAERMVGRAYNAGLDEANLSKEALAVEVQKQVPGFYVHFAPIGADPDKRDYIVSNQRLRDAGFVARRGLQEGIRELIRCYRMLPRAALGNA